MTSATTVCPDCEASHLAFEPHRCPVRAARHAKEKAEALLAATKQLTAVTTEATSSMTAFVEGAKRVFAEKEKRRKKWERAQRRRFAKGAQPPSVPRETTVASAAFLKHIALTKAKPLPVSKQVPMRNLADILGVAPGTKLTSLPLPDDEPPPLVRLDDAITTRPGESLIETVKAARVEPGPENPPAVPIVMR